MDDTLLRSITERWPLLSPDSQAAVAHLVETLVVCEHAGRVDAVLGIRAVVNSQYEALFGQMVAQEVWPPHIARWAVNGQAADNAH